MAGRDELDVLRSFASEEHYALSAYLDVSTQVLRGRAEQRLEAALAPYLNGEDGLSAEQIVELREDLEMIRIYLRGSAASRSRYLAIFSCAAELFWRVYPLDEPLHEEVTLSQRLSLAPLREAKRDLAPAGEHAGVARKRLATAV